MSYSLNSSSAVLDQYQNNQHDIVVYEQAVASFQAVYAAYYDGSGYSEACSYGKKIAYLQAANPEVLQLVQDSYCDAYVNGVNQQPLEQRVVQGQIDHIGIAIHENINLDNPMFPPLTRGRLALRDNEDALKIYRTGQAQEQLSSLIEFAHREGQKTQLNLG
jgi:hypothetical protein